LQRVLTTVTLLGLLVATAAAFAITEHLKLIKSDVFGTRVYVGSPQSRVKAFSPVCRCPTDTATVSIKLRHTGRVTMTIVDADGHEVRTLRSDVVMHARQAKAFVWDGRTDSGALAPDGVYHPWVELPRKTYRFTNNITVDTKPPRVRSAAVARPLLLAAPGRTVAIRYVLSGKAHAVVYLGRRRIIVGRETRPTDKIKWAGTLGGRPLRAGTYVLSVGARDVAGNETPAAQRKDVTVVVRYVALAPGRITVRGGGRFAVRVETAAPRYTWRLGNRRGAGRGTVLRLHAPTTPGTYRLVVAEHGHATTAVVRVRGR
jgi:hypothetical protein